MKRAIKFNRNTLQGSMASSPEYQGTIYNYKKNRHIEHIKLCVLCVYVFKNK